MEPTKKKKNETEKKIFYFSVTSKYETNSKNVSQKNDCPSLLHNKKKKKHIQ